MLAYGARVLPLELVPVPEHGAQICARAATKGCVQTGTRARARCPNLCSGINKRLCSDQCPCPGTVPKFVLGQQQKVVFRPVPVPGHGAQICARAATKGCVQTSAIARAPSLNGALDTTLKPQFQCILLFAFCFIGFCVITQFCFGTTKG